MHLRKGIIVISLIALMAAAAFVAIGISNAQSAPVLVNMQVTEYESPAALANVLGTMETFGIYPSTVFVGKEMAAKACPLLRDLDARGYEIGAFGYSLDANGAFVQLENLPESEQELIINGTKTSLEACIGHSVAGFRAQRFSKNNYTNEIVKSLGFTWDASFVSGVDPDASTFPYYSSKYGFYIVSIQGIQDSGRSYVLCDRAMASSGKTAQQWREAVEAHFLAAKRDGVPFVTEFHPNFLVSNQTWWGNFTELLAWLKDQDISYLTTQQMIENCSSSFPLTCGE